MSSPVPGNTPGKSTGGTGSSRPPGREAGRTAAGSGPDGRTLVEEISSLPPVQVQNALMRSADRDLALALHALSGDDRELFLAHVSISKAGRVRQQLQRLRTVNVTAEQQRLATELLRAKLYGASGSSSLGSYFKPRRPGS